MKFQFDTGAFSKKVYKVNLWEKAHQNSLEDINESDREGDDSSHEGKFKGESVVTLSGYGSEVDMLKNVAGFA